MGQRNPACRVSVGSTPVSPPPGEGDPQTSTVQTPHVHAKCLGFAIKKTGTLLPSPAPGLGAAPHNPQSSGGRT